mgnify:CR=1 FL=1
MGGICVLVLIVAAAVGAYFLMAGGDEDDSSSASPAAAPAAGATVYTVAGQITMSVTPTDPDEDLTATSGPFATLVQGLLATGLSTATHTVAGTDVVII